MNDTEIEISPLNTLKISQILKENYDVFWKLIYKQNEYIFICNKIDAVTFNKIFEVIQEEHPHIEHVIVQLGK